MELDVFELCTQELQARLLPMRERFKQLEDEQVEKSLTQKDKKEKKETKIETRDEPFSFPDGMYNVLNFYCNPKFLHRFWIK